MPAEISGTLDEYTHLPDEQFAEEWKLRYMLGRARMLPDVARWMRLLRFFHPTRLQDHWQDSLGNPLPKLYKSQGLSVEIYNWCRAIIEVYGSLLAGHKPFPFAIDVPPFDPTSELDRFMADAQEKLIVQELYDQKIPLHFLDFCTSVVLFGIGYVCSWIDPYSKRLRTTAIPWPGDVIPEWGSDRYGRGADALESVIITERIPLDAAKRLFPDTEFVQSYADFESRPDSGFAVDYKFGSVTIIKLWWRWSEPTASSRKEHIGYAELAIDGIDNKQPMVLYREDKTGYSDIPVRWAARFQTPGEPPHKAAGVLDDVVGINTEFNERLSAYSDMLMKLVYPKFKGKGFTSANVPRFSEGSNIIPMGYNQELEQLQEQVNNFPFDSFLSRLENMILMVSGLSRLIMGSIPPGSETSGEALNNLLHASISRLEVVRTPIQWAWLSLFEDVWIPMMRKFYKFNVKDDLGARVSVKVSPLLERFTRIVWVWPDVTPRDSIKAAQLAMNLGAGGYLSDETVMQRAQVPSVVDEVEKIRKQRQDPILHPLDKRNTLMALQMEMQVQSMAQGLMGSMNMQNAPGELDQSILEAKAAGAPNMGEEDNAPGGSANNAAQGLQGTNAPYSPPEVR